MEVDVQLVVFFCDQQFWFGVDEFNWDFVFVFQKNKRVVGQLVQGVVEVQVKVVGLIVKYGVGMIVISGGNGIKYVLVFFGQVIDFVFVEIVDGDFLAS